MTSAFINRLKVFRAERDWTQADLAERLGVSRQTVQALEKGRYDPSLPDVYGNRDQLIQVFLNLIKNAAEAVPEQGGEIILSTAYQHGVRLAVPGTDSRVHLPLLISVQDNGNGIPEDLRSHLFDPFVTTKRNGTGLGLALVAKLIGDHGGVIDFETLPRRTVFKVSLPMYADFEQSLEPS